MTLETILLSNDLTRFGTYIGWPHQDQDQQSQRFVTPRVADLVKAGFYYTGCEDIVRCFSCGLEVKVEEYFDPHQVHRARNPNCAFIMGNCNGSRFDYVASQEEYDSDESTSLETCKPATSMMPSSMNQSTFSQSQNRNNLLSPTSKSNNSPSNMHHCDMPDSNNVACCQHSSTRQVKSNTINNFTKGVVQLQIRRNSITDLDVQYQNVRKSNLRRAASDVTGPNKMCYISTKQHLNKSFDFEKLQESEEERVHTFNSQADITASKAKEFAKAGFFYTGPADRVQCAFCNGILQNLKNDDSLLEEHYKQYPDCSFAMELLSATVKPKPRHSKYKSEVVRLSSFYDWETSWHPKPVALAKAGFFYTGNEDRVRCFFCNGALCKWEPHDDPWREHARWFPKCPFVKQSKGQSYINEVSNGNTFARGQTTGDKSNRKVIVMKNHLQLLAQENRVMKKQKQCKICLDKEVSVTFTPCGHLVCCLSCAPSLKRCPICRALIRKMIRIFMS